MEALGELEKKVREAASLLAELRKKNRALASRVKKLQSELEAAGRDGTAADLPREREEVRRRVDKLARDLEKLVAE